MKTPFGILIIIIILIIIMIITIIIIIMLCEKNVSTQQNFDSLDALITAINKDCDDARAVLDSEVMGMVESESAHACVFTSLFT